MQWRTAALSVAGFGLLAAGCSSADPPPAVLPSLTATASPAASPVVIPSEATGNTSFALDAFVRFYFEQLNVAFSTSNPELIRALSDPQCATCENYAIALEDGMEFIQGPSFTGLEIAAPPVKAGGTVVEVVGLVPARRVLDKNGQVVRNLRSDGRFHFQVNVLRRETGWIVRGIRMAP